MMKIATLVGILILAAIFVYLTLRLLGVVKTITTEEVLWSFVGSQLYFDLILEKRLSRIEGRVGLRSSRKYPETL